MTALPRVGVVLVAVALLAVLAVLPNPVILRVAVAGAVLAGAVVSMQDLRRGGIALGVCVLGTVLLWASLRPSLERDWDPTQAVLARATVDETGVTFTEVRAFRWTKTSHTSRYRTLRCSFEELTGMDFIVSYFSETDAVAHTMVSFRCGDEGLVVSPEIRREEGEDFTPVRGLMRHFELMYVIADERDALHLRTHVRGERVFIFPAKATQEQLKALLIRFAERVEATAREPEFYNTAMASCATSLAADVQSITTEDLGMDWRVLMPGFSGEMVHELGLLQGAALSFEELSKKHAAHTDASEDEAAFSRAVRGLP